MPHSFGYNLYVNFSRNNRQFEFKGKTALITGGASGIGLYTAIELASRGVVPILVDINRESLDSAVELLESKGYEVHAFESDVTDIEKVRSLRSRLVEQGLEPDILMNSAGVALVAHIDSTPYEDWARIIDINLMGIVNTVTTFYPLMAKRGSGHIINVSSLLGVLPLPSNGPYTASKCGVVGFSESLYYDLKKHNIGVTVVCPGMVNTPLICPETFRDMPLPAKPLRLFENTMSKLLMCPEKLASEIADAVRDDRFMLVRGRSSFQMYSLRRHFPRLWMRLGSGSAQMFNLQRMLLSRLKDPRQLRSGGVSPLLKWRGGPVDLKGKKVMVTGGGSGIGLSAAIEFAGRGCEVLLLDINEGSLESASGILESKGFKAQTFVCDVTDIKAVTSLSEELERNGSSPDILFNSAGIALIAHADFLNYDDWKRTIDINLKGAINCIYAFYPAMAASGYGHIVNMGSIGGLVPLPSLGPYSTSKAGIAGLSESLSFDLREHNIGISVICPGGVNTPMFTPMPVRGLALKMEKFDKYAPGMLRFLISPEKLSVAIANAVVKRKFMVIPGFGSKAIYSLKRHFPRLWRLMCLQSAKMMWLVQEEGIKPESRS